jgi:hypothetical protein
MCAVHGRSFLVNFRAVVRGGAAVVVVENLCDT